MPDKVYALNVMPGIQLDGTQFAARNWTGGLWMRFQRGLPRKIGGYREIASTNSIIRGTYVVPNPPNFNVFYGTASNLYSLPINASGNTLGDPVDRTPDSFQSNVSNDWTFDNMYNASTEQPILIAHAAPNLASIASTVQRPIFYGNLNDNTKLQTTGFKTSGAITVLQTFLFALDNNGLVTWFEPNNPTQVRGSAIVSGDKIVAGIPARGGTNSPAGLLWTLTDLIRVTFTGNPNDDFNFDTVSTESSILSSRSIIEYDNIYYWLGVDRVMSYNGTCQEVFNNSNINAFFDRLNYAQRQKVWATKVTRFGEIWFHAPFGDSVECNGALIYNVREGIWYNTNFDSELISGRSDGYFDQTFSKPIWSGTVMDDAGSYPLFVHETGVDYVQLNGDVSAVEWNITTPSLSFCATALDNSRPEIEANTYLSRIEPDCIMSGSALLQIFAQEFAKGPSITVAEITFDNATQYIDLTVMGRQLYIAFSGNTIGSDFQMGQFLITGKIGDLRP